MELLNNIASEAMIILDNITSQLSIETIIFIIIIAISIIKKSIKLIIIGFIIYLIVKYGGFLLGPIIPGLI